MKGEWVSPIAGRAIVYPPTTSSATSTMGDIHSLGIALATPAPAALPRAAQTTSSTTVVITGVMRRR